VGACHARFLQSPCTFGFFIFTPDIYDVLEWCPGTITAKATEGATCSANGECSGDLYCNKGADYQCPGKCQKRGESGQSCAGGARCAEGLRCEAELCVPMPQAGDSCEYSCSHSVVCPAGEVCPGNLWCDRSLGKCELGRLVGEPCGTTGLSPTASEAECAIPLWCDAVDHGVGACRKSSAQGGPCNEATYACDKGLHCVGAVASGAGATLGACQPPSPAATDCREDDDCQAGLVCLFDECAAPVAEGEDCSGSNDCALGLVCVASKCAQARYPGSPCDGTRCTFSRCVDGICQDHAQVGEPCSAADDCATGECVAGVCYDDSVCNAPGP
jgi:hypothetical protein